MVPGTGIEPVRPLLTKRRILSPLCLPISPPGRCVDALLWQILKSVLKCLLFEHNTLTGIFRNHHFSALEIHLHSAYLV